MPSEVNSVPMYAFLDDLSRAVCVEGIRVSIGVILVISTVDKILIFSIAIINNQIPIPKPNTPVNETVNNTPLSLTISLHSLNVKGNNSNSVKRFLSKAIDKGSPSPNAIFNIVDAIPHDNAVINPYIKPFPLTTLCSPTYT